MNNIGIVLPHGFMGGSVSDSAVEVMLRAIATSIDPGESSWASKYGASINNDVFMMHRFCSCEKDDCPWCAGCTCEEEDLIIRTCDYCRGAGVYKNYGGFAGYGAPNFWHKKTNFSVWWYKYIGRSMVVLNEPNDLFLVYQDCIGSL